MEQADASPDVARLSDEQETRLSLALASTGSATERAGRAYLRMRGHEGGCIAIVGFEGDEDDVERRRLHSGALLRAGGGLGWGAGRARPGCAAATPGPYLRDALLDHGGVRRDARDGDHLEQPADALRGGRRRAAQLACRSAARRRW